MVYEITDQSFKKDVIDSEKAVLVDFWAPWCGPCLMMGPIIDELAAEFKDKIKFAKINVDENSETASLYEVMSIPSIKIFKGGKVQSEFVGAQGKEILKRELEKYVA